ncbi:hypothetical protein AMK16_20885 [Streptomyces sp. CB00455]|uniref:DUF2278 family protein n=1 Tax=Streptomyces sp. CB00455 TaxID=1703927 RepID=UPI00093BD6D0|nr:DUF2278 family protein [Streptomyces sp. CB00455]OKK17318.1 hypothetical protein AMK16_20885 [Streptomyces sp. CB00455]
MPLNAYGVLAGTLHHHVREEPDARGGRLRVVLEVDAPAGRYRCAVDVDGDRSGTAVQWKVLRLAASVLEPASALPPGYHDLSTSPGSGAIDHLRHPALADRSGRLFGRRPPAWLEGLAARLNPPRPWVSGPGPEAAQALEGVLVPGRPVLVFGEPLDQGLGLRNVHLNQGAPYGSPWWAGDGVWQDGAVLTRRPDGWYDAFLSRFSGQSVRTGADGHPA